LDVFIFNALQTFTITKQTDLVYPEQNSTSEITWFCLYNTWITVSSNQANSVHQTSIRVAFS